MSVNPYSNLRIGLDLRWTQQAYRNSPKGAIAGIGHFSQGLWLGLVKYFPEIELIAFVDRGNLPDHFLNMIEMAKRCEIYRVGLSGLIPSLDGGGRYTTLLREIESKYGLGIPNLDRFQLDVLHIMDQSPAPKKISCPIVFTLKM